MPKRALINDLNWQPSVYLKLNKKYLMPRHEVQEAKPSAARQV